MNCVELRLASTEENNEAGSGLSITWGTASCQFGKVFVAESERGLTHLAFFDEDAMECFEILKADWPLASFIRSDQLISGLVEKIFEPQLDDTFGLYLKGTSFQRKVWSELIKIPRGHVWSYSELARNIGNTQACRAVGTAVGANRISYLIPCHRVIQAGGKIGGFRWGIERKLAILASEKSFTPP